MGFVANMILSSTEIYINTTKSILCFFGGCRVCIRLHFRFVNVWVIRRCFNVVLPIGMLIESPIFLADQVTVIK